MSKFGCKTLPIIWGVRKTKALVYFLLALFSGMVVLINAIYTQLPFYYFLVFVFAPLSLFLLVLVRADTKRDFYILSQWCKVIMVLGVIKDLNSMEEFWQTVFGPKLYAAVGPPTWI